MVVIAVVAILTGLLLPALGSARAAAKQTRELAAGQQLNAAYALYSHDHRGNLLVGYATSAMTDPATPDDASLIVTDSRGERIYGVPARRYPWRIAPYMEHNFAGLYKDDALLKRYRERQDYQYVVSLSPSYGLNSAFVGGDADRFGFNPAATRAWGVFYITRDDQARRSSELVVFATARGVDPGGDQDQSVAGYFRIDAPRSTSAAWSTSESQARSAPQYSGHVDFRHGGKAATIMLDGHGTPLSFEALRDMRRWSDQATRPDWAIGEP